MSNTKFITFLSACGGAGATTLAMATALKLSSENKKVSLVIQDKEKFDYVNKLALPYSVNFLDKDLSYSPDLSAMIFVLTTPNIKINEMANKTGGENIVVSEPTLKGLEKISIFKDKNKEFFNFKVVFNKVLSGRKNHLEFINDEASISVKNRMIYEDIANGRNIFSEEHNIAPVIKREIEKIIA